MIDPLSPPTVGPVVGRDLINCLILKLTLAYMRMDHDQYTNADLDTMQTLWRHQCCQDALNAVARSETANHAIDRSAGGVEP